LNELVPNIIAAVGGERLKSFNQQKNAVD